MKKVLFLAAAMTLVATSAMAQAGLTTIVGSKHDLSATSGPNTSFGGNIDEICVFCHTPHAASADGAAFGAPLWNRALWTGGLADGATPWAGVSATLDVNPTGLALKASDAALCMSCHDGASMGGALVNPPNVSGITYPGDIAAGSDALLMDGTSGLTNDHPIAFDYAAVNAIDSGIRNQADAEARGAKFYNGSDMWCSSCHNVHYGEGNAFLKMPNAGSELCLACHAK